MKHSAGLAVSVKETTICIVDETGKIVQEAKAMTEPEAIVALFADSDEVGRAFRLMSATCSD